MATSIKLDEQLKSRVKQLAGLRQRSTHWVLCEAIRQYVEREEAREDFKQGALASWAAYTESGQHLTGPEVGAWLHSWGTGEEKPMPECHE